MKVNSPLRIKRIQKKQNSRERKESRSTKRPSAVLYFIVYILIYPILKICFRLKIERNDLELPDGPHIILSNHYTMIDFLLVMLSLYPHRLNAVGAQKWFLYSPLHIFLPKLGCIPKNMFDPDVRSIIGMKTVLNRGDGILLFPEGRCSSSHAYVGMHKSTGKMIKKFGVPVISSYIEGAVVCLPHWRKGFRSGRIRVTYRNLFSEDDIKSMSIDEINDAIDARLSGVEGALPTNKPFKTFGQKRLAEGLHQVLYLCPKCKMEFTTVTEANTIRCTACENTAVMDREAKLTPTPGSVGEKEISLWFRDQVRHEMETLSADMEPFIENVKVRTPSPKPGDGMKESGCGVMRLDPEGWHFEGEISGKQVSLFFPIDSIPAMSYDHCDNYQIYFGGDYYMFIPEDPRKCIKYVILAECMYWKFASKVMMTPGKNSGYV